jgi:hypothetical protein
MTGYQTGDDDDRHGQQYGHDHQGLGARPALLGSQGDILGGGVQRRSCSTTVVVAGSRGA